MVESRIKRALWAVSILIALGFGGNSAYEYYQEGKHAATVQEWIAQSRAIREECAGRSEEDRRLGLCESRQRHMSEAIIEFGHYRNEAAEEAQRSLVIAVGTPIALWTIFFLLGWIWTGQLRNSQPPVPSELKSSSGSEARTSRNWIERGYNGQVRLWKIFWFGYVAPLLPLSVVFQLYKETSDRLPSWVGLVGFLAIFLFQVWLVVALWRCAPNVNRPSFRRLGRAFAVFLGIVTLAAARAFLDGTS